MLATDIGLLALMAWLLTFIAHDVTHRTARLRISLATTRRQLHTAQQKLVREIEERESLQQSVDRARFHDAFTGLPNRYYFMEQLDRVLRARRDRRLCVFLIAIDRFQLINETLGHTAGDELMVQAGRRFQRAVSSASSVLARWGGDQFALLVRDLRSADDAPRLAAELQAVLQEPFELRRHRLGITARIGHELPGELAAAGGAAHAGGGRRAVRRQATGGDRHASCTPPRWAAMRQPW